MKSVKSWLAGAAFLLASVTGLQADGHDSALIIVNEDGREVLRLAPEDLSSGLKNLPRGRYLLKVEGPGAFGIELGAPTRLEIKRIEEEAEHEEEQHEEPRHKIIADESPVRLDFDTAAGDQEQRFIEIEEGTEAVDVQLVVYGAPDIYGCSVTIEYDPEHLAFANVFKPSSFIPGMVPLVLPEDGVVEVGGANFTKQTASGDGDLGIVGFKVLEGFSGETVLKITKVSLRTPTDIEAAEVESYGKIIAGHEGEHHEEHAEEEHHEEEHAEEHHGEALSGDEALKQLMEENACPGCDLSEANLMREDLSEADLQKADLNGANLFRTKFSEAQLHGANLHGANLLQANLRGANLSEADLSEARLTGAQLQEADLTGANLTDAKLSGANLTGAVWHDGRECKPGSIGRCR